MDDHCLSLTIVVNVKPLLAIPRPLCHCQKAEVVCGVGNIAPDAFEATFDYVADRVEDRGECLEARGHVDHDAPQILRPHFQGEFLEELDYVN